MAETRKTVATVIDMIEEDLGDSANNRWSAATLLRYVNDAMDDLAEAQIFRRTDVLVPTAGVGVYGTLAEVVDVHGVYYDGRQLEPLDQKEIFAQYGDRWQEESGENQSASQQIGAQVNLFPIPNTAGQALTFTGTPSITEAQGLGPMGMGFWSALSGTTVVHFRPGDGEVSNALTARYNLQVHYAYQPGSLATADYMPVLLERAAIDYVVGMALESSHDKADVRKCDRSLVRYERRKIGLAQRFGRNQSAEHITKQRPDDLSNWTSRDKRFSIWRSA